MLSKVVRSLSQEHWKCATLVKSGRSFFCPHHNRVRKTPLLDRWTVKGSQGDPSCSRLFFRYFAAVCLTPTFWLDLSLHPTRMVGTSSLLALAPSSCPWTRRRRLLLKRVLIPRNPNCLFCLSSNLLQLLSCLHCGWLFCERRFESRRVAEWSWPTALPSNKL